MPAAFFVAALVLTLSPSSPPPGQPQPLRPPPSAAARAPHQRGVPARTRPVRTTRLEDRLPAGLDPGYLYSARARARAANLLRLRLLELREAGLERAADAIRRRLPVDALLGTP